MSTSKIAGPAVAEPEKIEHDKAAGNKQGARSDTRHQRQRPRTPDIPSEEECVGAIAQVVRLLAMGLLKAPQANAIRASFRDILDFHRSRAKQSETGVSNIGLLDAVHENPKLLPLLEPLLTEQQIEWIMEDIDDSDDA